MVWFRQLGRREGEGEREGEREREHIDRLTVHGAVKFIHGGRGAGCSRGQRERERERERETERAYRSAHGARSSKIQTRGMKCRMQ